MKHRLSIGSSRYIGVNEDNEVIIRDEENIVKRAVFTDKQWIKFCNQIPYIDMAIRCAITLKPTNYRIHVGGNWHVTITDEMPFVDIRRWFIYSQNDTLRLSQIGIALTFDQWNHLKLVVDQLKGEFDNVESCWHLNWQLSPEFDDDDSNESTSIFGQAQAHA